LKLQEKQKKKLTKKRFSKTGRGIKHLRKDEQKMEAVVTVMVGFQPDVDGDNWQHRGRRFVENELSDISDFQNEYEVMGESDSDVVGIQIERFYADNIGWIEPEDMKKAIDVAEALLDDFKVFMKENLPEEHEHYAEKIEVIIPITCPY
jgi:hypothetical protein